MKVELIQASSNVGEKITKIASICYGNEEAKNPDKLLKNLYKLGHTSTFEHIYYTFKIEGISRSCLAQLVRHRLTSPTVESQRYVDQSDRRLVVPNTIREDTVALGLLKGVEEESIRVYNKLRKLGIPKEDARYILPIGFETREYLSLNLREFIHIVKVRSSKTAQWEIRDLVNKMVEEVLIVNPELEFIFKE